MYIHTLGRAVALHPLCEQRLGLRQVALALQAAGQRAHGRGSVGVVGPLRGRRRLQVGVEQSLGLRMSALRADARGQRRHRRRSVLVL